MNYSNKTYGRRIIKGSDAYVKRILLIMVVCFIAGGLLGILITGFIVHKKSEPLGKLENVVIKNEPKLNWSSDKDFIPLDVPLDVDVQEYIYYLSNSYNIDYSLIMAVIDTESGFNADIVSSTNDFGLMQINKCNHKWIQETLGITNFLDAKQNASAGIYVLRRLFEVNGNDTVKVLMAYNMGQTGAERCWKQGIHSTSYTEKIIKKQLEFQNQIKEIKENE
jgi:putative murein lytic transglycosylase yjbJ